MPFPLTSLLPVTPTVMAKVDAYKLAQAVKESAWAEYQRLMDKHNSYVRAVLATGGRKPRRGRTLVLAEQRLNHVEHLVSVAVREIEMQVRVENPGAAEPSIQATKRELLRAAA